MQEAGCIKCTPAEKFLSDPTPLRPVSENDIRLLRVERKHTRIIGSEGIEFRGRYYIHPDQTLYMGEVVEIGEWPNDEARIDAFIGGQHLNEWSFEVVAHDVGGAALQVLDGHLG